MAQDFDTAYPEIVAEVLRRWADANETTDTYADATKSVQNAVTNVYQEEYTRDQWIAAALDSLNGVSVQ